MITKLKTYSNNFKELNFLFKTLEFHNKIIKHSKAKRQVSSTHKIFITDEGYDLQITLWKINKY